MPEEPNKKVAERDVVAQRWRLLRKLEESLEFPMVALGFVWVILFVVEMLGEPAPFVLRLGTAIWVAFIVDFLLKFIIAPKKMAFIRRSWLAIFSLMLPAIRVLRLARMLRVLRMARGVRGLTLLRLLTSVNRGMRSLKATMSRRGLGYAVLLTIVVTFGGAAGMYAFEKNPGGEGLNSFSAALWWTAMMVTTSGSGYWPQTPEGQILCLLIAIYAFAVFGYVAATLASFFIDRDAASESSEVAGAKGIERLRLEIAQLREELKARPLVHPQEDPR